MKSKKVVCIILSAVTVGCFMTGTLFADFTIGVMPDTQNLSDSAAEAHWISDMTQFFVDEKDTLDVIFVAALGDMTQNNNNSTEWGYVRTAYDLLENAGIAYCPCEGNHDSESSLNAYFPESSFVSNPNSFYVENLGGMENAVFLFEADGMEFVLVVIEDGASADELAWGSARFSEHSDRRGIMVTHFFFAEEKNMIRENDNVFMGLHGHDTADDGERYEILTSQGGTTQHLFMSDYQGQTDCLQGAMVRYYTFKPYDDEIDVRSYNIVTSSYEIDSDSHFTISYDMEPPSAPSNSATFVSQTVPSAMNPNEVQSVQVEMFNDGLDAWTSAAGHALGSVNPVDNTTWGLSRVAVTGTVATNTSRVFNFDITAPATAGMYNLQWQMIDESGANLGWFGSQTLNALVNVGNLYDTSSAAGTVTDDGVSVPAAESSDKAFDDDVNTKFLSFSTSATVQYQYPNNEQYMVVACSLTSANDAPDRDPVDVVLKGSNDGSNWTTLGSATGLTYADRFTKTAFNVNNSTAYEYYQVEMANSNPNNILQVAEIELLTPGNMPPQITSSPDLTVDEMIPYSYTVTATDPDGDPVTLTVPTLPGWLSFDGSELAGTPTVIGTYPVVIRASDAMAYSEQSFSIVVSSLGNDAPVITSIPVTGVIENDPYSYTMTATDADGDSLTYIGTTVPAGFTFTGGVLSGSTAVLGLKSVVLSVSDGTVTVDQEFNIMVFDTPVPDNLTQNFSFEDGTTSWSTGGSAASVAIAAPDGSNALRINTVSGPTTQEMPLEIGETYNLSVWVNASAVTTGPWVFDTNDKYDGAGQCQWALGSNGGWTEYTGSFVATNTPLRLRMFTEAAFVGTVYFDNIVVAPATAANVAPVITSVPITDVDAGAAYSYKLLATDVEGDPLTYIGDTVPAGLTFDAGTQLLTSTGLSAGDYDVQLSVSDGTDTDVQNFTITATATQVAVPDVVGQSQSSAEADIVAAGLTVGNVTTANSETVPAGDVISQNPVASTQVDPGAPVDLVISDGPALTGYEAWQVAEGVDDNIDTDPDNDGRDNLYEYVLGGDPDVPGDVVDPTLSDTGGTYKYSYSKRNDDPDLSYRVQVCTDLATGTWADAVIAPETNSTDGAYSDVSHTIPTGQTQSYIRLQVENQ